MSRYQKGKTNLDFTGARDSEWQWHQLGRMQVCTLLQTDNHASTAPFSFYSPDALPAAQPTASKHQRQIILHKAMWPNVAVAVASTSIHSAIIAIRTDVQGLIPVVRQRLKSGLPHVNLQQRVVSVIRRKHERVVAGENQRPVWSHYMQATRLATSVNT